MAEESFVVSLLIILHLPRLDYQHRFKRNLTKYL